MKKIKIINKKMENIENTEIEIEKGNNRKE